MNSAAQPDRKHCGWISWLLGENIYILHVVARLVLAKNIRAFLHLCFPRPLRHKFNMKFKSSSHTVDMCGFYRHPWKNQNNLCSNKPTGVCESDCTAVQYIFRGFHCFHCSEVQSVHVLDFKEDGETRRTLQEGNVFTGGIKSGNKCFQITENFSG